MLLPKCRFAETTSILQLFYYSSPRLYASASHILGHLSKAPVAMAQLTQDQLAFLKQQRIPLTALFDASGMASASWKIAMKVESKQFAYGVSPCRRGHESIRTRAGHCIQCDHARIAFMRHNDEPRDLFIAGSVTGKFIKLTNAKDVQERMGSLNREKYGAVSDWLLLMVAELVPSAGNVEASAATSLDPYRVGGVYYAKNGKNQQCYDLFACSLSTASKALAGALPKGRQLRSINALKHSDYQFQDRITAGLHRVGNRS